MSDLTLQDIITYLNTEHELGGEELLFSESIDITGLLSQRSQLHQPVFEEPAAPQPAVTSSFDPAPPSQPSSSPAVFEGKNQKRESAPETPPSAEMFAKAGGWKPARNTFALGDIELATDIETFNQKVWEHSYYQKEGHHSHLLFGTGPISPRVMLITTWPFQEDINLKAPFTGIDGELLSKMLKYIQVEFNLCYTTFLKKANHKGKMMPRELSFLKKMLLKEISIVQPNYILLLGKKAAQMILDNDDPFSLQGTTLADTPTYITYHPRELSDNDKKREAVNHLDQLARNFK